MKFLNAKGGRPEPAFCQNRRHAWHKHRDVCNLQVKTLHILLSYPVCFSTNGNMSTIIMAWAAGHDPIPPGGRRAMGCHIILFFCRTGDETSCRRLPGLTLRARLLVGTQRRAAQYVHQHPRRRSSACRWGGIQLGDAGRHPTALKRDLRADSARVGNTSSEAQLGTRGSCGDHGCRPLLRLARRVRGGCRAGLPLSVLSTSQLRRHWRMDLGTEMRNASTSRCTTSAAARSMSRSHRVGCGRGRGTLYQPTATPAQRR